MTEYFREPDPPMAMARPGARRPPGRHTFLAPPPRDVPEAGRPDAGSRMAAMGARVVSIVMVAVLVVLQVSEPVGPAAPSVPGGGPAGASALDVPRPSPMLVMAAKLAVGAAQTNAPVSQRETLVRQAGDMAATNADEFRVAVLAGEVLGAEEAGQRLRSLEAELEPGSVLAGDVASAQRVYAGGGDALPAGVWEELQQRHGYFGRLLAVQGRAPSDPARAELLASASAMIVLLTVLGVAILAVGLLALALAVTAAVLAALGQIRGALRAPAPGGSVYLETFALFVTGFVVLKAASPLLERTIGPAAIGLQWALLAVPLWPLMRGVRFEELRRAIGWHRGQGVLREVGAGLTGYLAGLPVIALGVGVSLLLLAIQGAILGPGNRAPPPSHPAVDMLGSGNAAVIVAILLLAVVWAPVAEESVFRGALYRHLRGGMGWVASGLLSGFVFAVIHPQGILLTPALMSIGFVMAALREWRGSLIAPMTAHAVHNGALMTVVLLLFSA